MANIRKSFNFVDGLQVDFDSFVVNSVGNVGVGTSAPSVHLFNVYGSSRVTGLTTTGTLSVSGISTLNEVLPSSIGIGTTSPRCVLDLGESAGGNNGFVLFPSTSISQRNGIGSTIEGAIIYNNTSKRLELYNGTGWVGIATVV